MDPTTCAENAACAAAAAAASWGGPDDAFINTAIKSACNAGMLFVVAAGNAGKLMSNDATAWPGRLGANPEYPCVLTVAASTSSGGRASFSNYGNEVRVCLCACVPRRQLPGAAQPTASAACLQRTG